LIPVNQVNQVGFLQSYSTEPWVGQQVRFKSKNGSRREIILRGLPDEVVPDDWTKPIFNAQWIENYAVWQQSIQPANQDSPWMLKILNPNIDQLKFVTNITVQPDGSLLVNCPGHGLATGDLMEWFRAKVDYMCLRGRHRAIRVDVDNFKLTDYNYKRIVFYKAQIRRVTSADPANPLAYDPLIATFIEGIRRKKTGRPFGLLAGRAKTCKH
jgi:hypothetical protein